MKKKFEMNLLNAEQMYSIAGGNSCSKSGDTVYCGPSADIKLCITLESTCKPNFSSKCNDNGFSITCGTYKVKPPWVPYVTVTTHHINDTILNVNITNLLINNLL
jgi:hypothetical protein